MVDSLVVLEPDHLNFIVVMMLVITMVVIMVRIVIVIVLIKIADMFMRMINMLMRESYIVMVIMNMKSNNNRYV